MLILLGMLDIGGAYREQVQADAAANELDVQQQRMAGISKAIAPRELPQDIADRIARAVQSEVSGLGTLSIAVPIGDAEAQRYATLLAGAFVRGGCAPSVDETVGFNPLLKGIIIAIPSTLADRMPDGAIRLMHVLDAAHLEFNVGTQASLHPWRVPTPRCE